MSRRLLFLSVVLGAFASGCTSASGLRSDQAQVHLERNNYRVVAESVRGTSSALRIFGIGGGATYAEAMGELRQKALLMNEAAPRALVNVTSDETFTLFLGPLVTRSQVIVTADVIEFLQTGADRADPVRKDK